MSFFGSILGSISTVGDTAKGIWDAINPIGLVTDALGISEKSRAHAQANEDQRNLLDRQEGFTQKMAEQTHQWNIEDWERQNEYNKPSAQLERLKAAGINPNAAGGVAPSTASTAVTSDLPSTPSALASNLGALASLITAQQNSKLIDAQRENLEADTKLKTEKSVTESETRDLVKGMMKSETDLNNSNVKLNIKKEQLTDEQINEVKASVDKLTKESANLAKEFEILDQELILKKKEVNWYDKRVQQELRESASRIGLNGAQASAAVKYATLLGEQYNTQVQLTKGARLQNGVNAINFEIADKTKDATVQIQLAKGKKANVYLDTPEWTNKVNGFVNELAPGVQLFMNYLKIGSGVVEVADKF